MKKLSAGGTSALVSNDSGVRPQFGIGLYGLDSLFALAASETVSPTAAVKLSMDTQTTQNCTVVGLSGISGHDVVKDASLYMEAHKNGGINALVSIDGKQHNYQVTLDRFGRIGRVFLNEPEGDPRLVFLIESRELCPGKNGEIKLDACSQQVCEELRDTLFRDAMRAEGTPIDRVVSTLKSELIVNPLLPKVQPNVN